MPSHRTPEIYLHEQPLESSYDVVIIGGGGHGLATAYYLAREHGVRKVAVLERSYIGSGGTGRNTTVLRANYKTPGCRWSSTALLACLRRKLLLMRL